MKIEVGDTVSKKDGTFFSNGKKKATLEKIDHIGAWLKETKTHIPLDKLIKYQPSPIRTVTRREIVAGVYGRVVVGVKNGDKVVVDLTANDGTLDYIGHTSELTYIELREAAHILNQIAEVLEGNGK